VVQFVDYGNQSTVQKNEIKVLPAAMSVVPPAAAKHHLKDLIVKVEHTEKVWLFSRFTCISNGCSLVDIMCLMSVQNTLCGKLKYLVYKHDVIYLQSLMYHI